MDSNAENRSALHFHPRGNAAFRVSQRIGLRDRERERVTGDWHLFKECWYTFGNQLILQLSQMFGRISLYIERLRLTSILSPSFRLRFFSPPPCSTLSTSIFFPSARDFSSRFSPSFNATARCLLRAVSLTFCLGLFAIECFVEEGCFPSFLPLLDFEEVFPILLPAAACPGSLVRKDTRLFGLLAASFSASSIIIRAMRLLVCWYVITSWLYDERVRLCPLASRVIDTMVNIPQSSEFVCCGQNLVISEHFHSSHHSPNEGAPCMYESLPGVLCFRSYKYLLISLANCLLS